MDQLVSQGTTMKFPKEVVSLDIETSGTDPETHSILSIGIVHPDSGAEFYREIMYNNLYISPQAIRINKLDVTKLDEPPRKYIGMVDNEARVFLDNLGVGGKKIALGWNVGGFDLKFIQIHMPQTFSRLSYRTIDLSSLCYGRDIISGSNLGQFKESIKTTSSELHNALFDAKLAILQFEKVCQA